MKQWMLYGALALAASAVACNRAENRTPGNDAAVAMAVRHDLAQNQVPGAIDVAVSEGIATLSGTVPDADSKQRAERVADDVRGVDRVVNNLRTSIAADAPGPRPGVGGPLPGAVNVPGAPAPNAPDMR